MGKKIQEEKHSIVISAAIYVITLLICIAMFLPQNVGNVLKISGDAIKTFEVKDITKQINCNIQPSGEYTIEGSDPQLFFSLDGQEVECVKLNISTPVEKAVSFEVYTALEDKTFSAERCYTGGILIGETAAVVDIPKGEYHLLRVDIDDDNVRFENIELYDAQPDLVPYVPEFSVWDYAFVIVLPIAAAAIIYFINKRTAFFQNLIGCIIKNRFNIILFAVYTAVALLLAVLVELIFKTCSNESFNVYRWIFFAGIAELAVVFILGYKNLKDKPENLFLPIVLVLGCVMLFGSPIKHICWDLDSHYPWSVQTSYANETYVTVAYQNVDKNLSQSMVLEGFTLESYKRDLEYLNQAEEILVYQQEPEFSISHLPAGIVIAVARMFGASFAVKYNLGRLAGLLLYAVICYFAIKRIKSGKMILSTICLLPTGLFMATNFVYDWWVIAFSILGVSYYTSILQEPQKIITAKETLIMCGAFALASLPKLVYVIMMFIPLFMFKKWSGKKEIRRYYLILVAIFAAVFAMFMLKSLNSIGGSGDSRGGAVDPSGQIALIFSEPLRYTKTLIKFLSQYLSIGTMKQYISNFAYLGIGNCGPVFIALIAFTALTDSNRDITFKIPVIIKICAILLFVGLAALIATALYIDFTPLGYDTILGCQPRYIIPLLSPLLLLITGQRINCIKNKAVYNGAVLGVCSAAVMMDIYSQITSIMI